MNSRQRVDVIKERLSSIKGGTDMQKLDKETEDVISALRQNGVEYNDIIKEYGIDSSIVEQYEDKYYEHGYGDVSDRQM